MDMRESLHENRAGGAKKWGKGNGVHVLALKPPIKAHSEPVLPLDSD